MTEAAKRVIDFGFTDLGLARINVYAATDNIASNATIKKLGFTFEGMQKKATRSKATGQLYDRNAYGMLKEDWEKNYSTPKRD
jgi:RimJ/RimL family protein N-acetyltransferase